MGNNIAVSITADVIDLQAKRAVMSAELKAATKDLNAFAKEAASTGATEELRAGMLASADAAEKAKAKIALVTQELKELNKVPEPPRHGFEGVTASISETGVHLRESIGMFTEFRAALAEVAEVVMVAFAVERIAEWADHMGEAAEKTKHLAETFGMTVPEVQGLDAIAKETGLDFEALAKGMGILDKNTYAAAEGNKKAAAALEAVGVSANDGKTQMERMLIVADKFAAMDDGPKKVALSMQLFGKSGKDLIPILNMGAEGLQEMDRVTQEYGAGAMFATEANKELRTWLDQVNARGMALADATDTTKVAMQGLGNVMTDAFSPVLTAVTESMNEMVKSFIESYREGGVVAVVMGTITTAIEAVWSVVKALGDIFFEVFGAVIELVRDVAVDIMDAFGVKTPQAMNAAEVAWNVFKDVVVIAKDLILICIESIIAMIQELIGDLTVLGRVAYDALSLNWGSIEGDWANGMAKVGKQVEATTAKIKGHAAEMNQAIGAAIHGQGMPGKPGEAHGTKGVKDFDPAMSGGGKKEHKESIAQKLEEELEARKTAWAMEQDAQGTYQQFSLQSEANFWAQALKRSDLTAKDRLDVERKYLAARAELLKEKQAQEQADAKQSEALALEAAKNEGELAKNSIQAKIENLQELRQVGAITANQELQQRALLNAQLYQLDIDLENKEHAIKLKALQDDRAILGMKPAYYRQIDNQIELLEKQHNDRLVLLNATKNRNMAKDDAAIARERQRVFQQSFQGFATEFAKLATLQQGFLSTMRNMWGSFVGMVQQAVSRMVVLWITSLAQKEAAGKAFHLKQVLLDAKAAAAGAFAAVSHIPIVGPILAPIAAAAAFAGTMAFASAEKGWDVPGGNGPGLDGRGGMPAIIHPREMVLPAPLADNVRNGAMGGDTHYHVTAIDAKSFEKFLKKHNAAVGAGGKMYARMGGR